MKTKVIRFTSRSRQLRKHSYEVEVLSKQQTDIYVHLNQKPYMAVLDSDKVVACLWLEKDTDDNYFSIITHPKHRNKGYASMLVRELVSDRFAGKLQGELSCLPVNPIMKRIIKRFRFTPDFTKSEFWSFDL